MEIKTRENKLTGLVKPKKRVGVLPEERAQKLIKKYKLPETCREELVGALQEAYQRGHDCDIIAFKHADYVPSELEIPNYDY